MAERAGWLPEALNEGWIYRDRIAAPQDGQWASAFYADRYRHSPPSLWLERLQAGEILRNGARLWGDVPLVRGDQLAWQRPPWREAAVPALGACLHDDGDLCVLDKPSGLPVLPAGGWLEHTLLRQLERRHRGDPAGIPRPVHRLGRFTSGLLVCARRPTTRAWLSAALRDSTAAALPESPGDAQGDPPLARDPHAAQPAGARLAEPSGTTGTLPEARPLVRKLYRALLPPGGLALAPGDSVLISTPIGRRPHPRLGWIWCAGQHGCPGDLVARSRLTLLERGPHADLVCVAIGSGRPHQIRIHCAALGAPLLGDPLYRPGGDAAPQALPGDGGYRLQAWRLELQRPDGERLELQVPTPLALPSPG